MPTLSVLTPSFNYAWCIEDALNSVAELRRTPQAAGMSSTSWSTMIHMTVALSCCRIGIRGRWCDREAKGGDRAPTSRRRREDSERVNGMFLACSGCPAVGLLETRPHLLGPRHNGVPRANEGEHGTPRPGPCATVWNAAARGEGTDMVATELVDLRLQGRDREAWTAWRRHIAALRQSPLPPARRAAEAIRSTVLVMTPSSVFPVVWWATHDGRSALASDLASKLARSTTRRLSQPQARANRRSVDAR
jgi:hypothetical protein